MNDTTFEHVKEIVEKVVRKDGLEVVDIQFPRFKSKQVVRVFIDKEGGVTLDDCKRISMQVGEALEIEDPFPMRYTLEISSPGIDRPLKTTSDFKRNIGRTLRIMVSESTGETMSYTGVLKELKEDFIVLETSGGIKEVPLISVVKGQVCIPF